MRYAQRPNPQKQQTAASATIVAPYGGWDALNSLASMPAQNAVILDNWVPRPGLVELRRGFIQQADTTASGAPVSTLIPFRSVAGADKLFAATGGALYDVSGTAPLNSPALPVYSPTTGDRFNYTGFANAAANWTIACNGSDAPIGYHAATGVWAPLPTLTFTGPPTFDPTKLFNVFEHQGRLHFLETGTLHVWNPDAGAVGGAVTLLDLSSVFSKGGSLVAGANWSATIGLLTDIFAVYVTNQGQVAVYQGIDPTDATNWSLVNVYDLGPPVGQRALVKFGGDLNVITSDGVIPLSQAIRLDRAEQTQVALTANIVRAFQSSTKTYGANYGWQAILYPGATPSTDPDDIGGSLVIINVPTVQLGASVQYVQSMLGGGWCRFRDPLSGVGLPAFCWEIMNGCVYFGSATGVYQWDVGSSDNGDVITADVLPAWSNFGAMAKSKEFTMLRPFMNVSERLAPALAMCVDYQVKPPTATPTVIDQSGDTEIRFDWTSDGNVGYVGAPYMRMSVAATDFQDVLATDSLGDTLAIDAGGDNLLISGAFTLTCQLYSFDVVFNVAKGTSL